MEGEMIAREVIQRVIPGEVIEGDVIKFKQHVHIRLLVAAGDDNLGYMYASMRVARAAVGDGRPAMARVLARRRTGGGRRARRVYHAAGP